jgi:hypothetical protein
MKHPLKNLGKHAYAAKKTKVAKVKPMKIAGITSAITKLSKPRKGSSRGI